jgi:hypothetical protein
MNVSVERSRHSCGEQLQLLLAGERHGTARRDATRRDVLPLPFPFSPITYHILLNIRR